MIIGLGSGKSSIATDNNFSIKDSNDKDEVFRTDSGNKDNRASFATSNLGFKPIPKATFKQYNVNDDQREEKQFVMSIKDILKQSTTKDPREKEPVVQKVEPKVVQKVIGTCSSKCSKSCKCQTSKKQQKV
jgi:hypothetical protein